MRCLPVGRGPAEGPRTEAPRICCGIGVVWRGVRNPLFAVLVEFGEPHDEERVASRRRRVHRGGAHGAVALADRTERLRSLVVLARLPDRAAAAACVSGATEATMRWRLRSETKGRRPRQPSSRPSRPLSRSLPVSAALANGAMAAPHTSARAVLVSWVVDHHLTSLDDHNLPRSRDDAGKMTVDAKECEGRLSEGLRMRRHAYAEPCKGMRHMAALGTLRGALSALGTRRL